MNCQFCNYQLPDRGFYCPSCSAQVRCKKCVDILEPNSSACVMCGTKLNDEVETIITEANNTDVAVNTFELHETTKNRIIRAKFTDNVGTVFAETLALFTGNRLKPADSQRQGAKHHLYNIQPPHQGYTPDNPDLRQEEVDNNSNEVSDIGKNFTDLEKINKIFRFEEGRVTLKEPRLKAENKIDYGRRLVYLFLYANALRGTNEVSRDDINSILKEANVYDGNIRYWIAKSPDLTTNNGTYELRNTGENMGKQILGELFDANKPDGWIPGTKTTKSSSIKKTKKEKDNEETVSKEGENEKTKKTSTKGSLPSPTNILNRLINEGFFTEVREIQEIIAHCKTLGYSYKSNDFSMPLLRLVRMGKINRTTNQAGRYEYKT